MEIGRRVPGYNGYTLFRFYYHFQYWRIRMVKHKKNVDRLCKMD
jgi:hypothetical protein